MQEITMTSSNGNIFRVTGLLCGHRWIPQKSGTQSFDVFFDPHLDQQLSEQWRRWWFETPLCSLWRQCNGFEGISSYSETTWAVGIAQLTHHEVQGGGKNPETEGQGIFVPTADRVVS